MLAPTASSRMNISRNEYFDNAEMNNLGDLNEIIINDKNYWGNGMLKGCKKQMIVLRGTGSEIFDEAYFVLKNGVNAETCGGAMLTEANRIVEENRTGVKKAARPLDAMKSALFFVCGTLLGAGIALLSVFLS